jgi:hypothetical protein
MEAKPDFFMDGDISELMRILEMTEAEILEARAWCKLTAWVDSMKPCISLGTERIVCPNAIVGSFVATH